ncbi:hypothetical protein H4Q26_011629 [Puccinia striiformis f. sp. tritici PST-130]|nr:hypothetical protein H4Q26_011629 [Puccinia striiformis f. sp. tritici PST-130]
MAGSRPPLSEHSRMALRNPESTELEEMADEDSDDPIDMLSSKSKTSSRRKAGPSRDPSQSLLNPTIDLPPKCEVKSGSPSRSRSIVHSFWTASSIKTQAEISPKEWPESLTPAQQIVVDEGLRADNSIVYDLPGASCGRKELQNCPPQLIGLMTRSLTSMDPKTSGDEALNVHCFSSFFMIQFDLGGHPKVSRWTRKINIFEKDLIFFPINLSNLHWVLGVINNRKKRFEYYDSLGGSGSGVLSKLRRYYQDEYQARKDEDVDLNEWSDYQPEVPLQSNSSDCGVFVCQFMYSLSQDLTDHNLQEGKVVKLFDFTAENMPYLRLKMAFEIIRKSFLSDQSYYH